MSENIKKVNLDMEQEDRNVSNLVPKDALEVMQTRNILFDKVMSVAINATNFADWIDQSGKPYLQGSGAEKVARRFGIRIYDVQIEREDLEDEKGKYYLYTTMGKAALGSKDVIEAIGTCSSRDKFFGTKGGVLKEIQDVDLPNIKKKSYTNFTVNAVTRLLGIRNLTWEELTKYGISKDGKTSIKYDGGANNATASKKFEASKKNAKEPFWLSDYNDKKYLFASTGDHFSADFLIGLSFKKSDKKENLYFRDYSESILNALREEFEAAESVIKEGGCSDE
jgi:hypothetical protein